MDTKHLSQVKDRENESLEEEAQTEGYIFYVMNSNFFVCFSPIA